MIPLSETMFGNVPKTKKQINDWFEMDLQGKSCIKLDHREKKRPYLCSRGSLKLRELTMRISLLE